MSSPAPPSAISRLLHRISYRGFGMLAPFIMACAVARPQQSSYYVHYSP